MDDPLGPVPSSSCVTRATLARVVARLQMDLAHIRHIPVVDEHHRVVGIVSSRDLVRSRAGRPIRELMVHPALTVSPSTPAHQAAALLREHKFGSLPVVGDDQQLVGIIIETDCLAVAEEALGGHPAAEPA
jgi:Mg/Co/Ni transporter MgtE